MTDLMIAVRAVHLAATVLTAGAFAFRVFVCPRGPDASITARTESDAWLGLATAWWVLTVLLTWVVWLALTAAEMSGTSVPQALSPDVLRVVLTQSTFGRVWMVRFALAVLLAIELPWLQRKNADDRAQALAGGLTSALLLVSLAWAGHAVGTSSLRPLHLGADALHLLGAGWWLGALAPLLFVLSRARTQPGQGWSSFAATATRRFSAVGLFAVGTILVTGLINAWLLVGSVTALTSTAYGQLALAKLALFVAILFIAAFNRLRLTPRLSASDLPAGGKPLKQLWRNVILEMLLGAAAVAIAAVLGTMPPSSHRHGPGMHDMNRPHVHAIAQPLHLTRATLRLQRPGVGCGVVWPHALSFTNQSVGNLSDGLREGRSFSSHHARDPQHHGTSDERLWPLHR
jgi:copper resistance protein D